MASYENDLYRRLHRHLETIRVIDTHEHLHRPAQYPAPEHHNLGRLFSQGVNWDLVSAGMPKADMLKVEDDRNGLSARERWKLIAPWYEKTRLSSYWEALRLAIRGLYDIDDFSDSTVDSLVEKMRRLLRPGATRAVFDRAGIDYAMNNPFPLGVEMIYRHCAETDCFITDMHDAFAEFPLVHFPKDTSIEIAGLDDYLRTIDWYFERYGHIASAYKMGHAYWRSLDYGDPKREDVVPLFRRLAVGETLTGQEKKPIEDFIVHYLCDKCAEYGLRVKFHCGLQAYNGIDIRWARAGLLLPLFLKHPKTNFDIYHIAYPYWEEAVAIVKMFPNVTLDFCWAWNVNQVAARQALSSALECVPLNKLHGYGGDYICLEGTYGTLVAARREIARVLSTKVEEGWCSEADAAHIGEMLLRDNPLANFDLPRRRKASSPK